MSDCWAKGFVKKRRKEHYYQWIDDAVELTMVYIDWLCDTE
ncbi:hypothetical protein NT06LI_0575 [Listeria innocua FSL J1-023]|nr:hypothetical protein NT06LI_0575 [Listeria innocua FSL J1-023]